MEVEDLVKLIIMATNLDSLHDKILKTIVMALDDQAFDSAKHLELLMLTTML